GGWRAIKIVYRSSFDHDRPFEREFEGIQKFEPLSRAHPSQLNILHVGRNDEAGYFYHVMELADDGSEECRVQSEESRRRERRNGVMEDGREEKAADNKSSTPSSSPAHTPTPQRPSTSAVQDPAAYVPRTLKLELYRRNRLPVEECIEIALAL